MRSLINSFNYAVTGIITALKNEKNMMIHYIIAIIVITVSLFLDFSRLEFIVLIFTICLVLVMEMINTAIENIINLVSPDYNPLAKIVKDVAAGAVLISAVNAIVVGYLLFFDRLSGYTEIVLVKIKNSPIHLTFIAIFIVILLTIGLKTKFYRGRGNHFQGGTVSGHAAISFCLATIIVFLTKSMLVATLAYALAILVAESRIEGEIHTLDEVIFGGLLGVLIGIVIFQFK